MQFFLWIFVAAHFYGNLILCMGPCRDTLKAPGIEVRNKENKVLGHIITCEKLKIAFPQICATPEGRARCCQTCQHVDSNCLDDGSRFRSPDGSDLYTCSEYIAQDPCNCRQVLKYPGQKNVVVRKRCCASCKDVVTTDCNCQDLDSDGFSVPLSNGHIITSCKELAENFPELCVQYGKARSSCCQSCAGVATKCLDTRFRVWNVDDENLECPQLIAKDKCYCKADNVRKACCNSCSGQQDLSDCCINNPEYRVTITTKNNGICPECTCAQLEKEGYLKRACRAKRKARENCCKACRRIGIDA